MVRFTCDSKNNYLLIEEYSEQMDIDAPYPRVIKPKDTTISVRGLMWATESANGVVTWNQKAIRRACRLGKNTYVAILSGYKYNENVQGMCGAGSPTFSLTIHKDRKLVAKDLVFSTSCASPNLIKSIRFEPKINLALISILNGTTQIEKELRVSTKTPLSRKQLFGEE